MRQPWTGIGYLGLAIACIFLGLPLAGVLAGIAVYFTPDGIDSVGVGWNTTIFSVFVACAISLIVFALAMFKGGKHTRKLGVTLAILTLMWFGISVYFF